jgi:enediyne biosynthesis protein E3
VKTLLAILRRRLLGLQAVETSYVRRGFRGATADVQARLDRIGAAFLGGYHAALEHDTPADLAAALHSMEADLCGFAFEGAAMGLALLDFLTPWRRTRISGFLRGAGDAHAYMAHVGAGWVWARWPVNVRRAGQHLDPVLGWLAFDGWGFHEGFFHWPKYIAAQPPPEKLKGFERRVFDQGFGRSLWFVNGGNIELIAQTISIFPPGRQFDLWSGIGLAATYAGSISEASLGQLRDKSGSFQPQLAQGAAFAAKARQRAGNMTDYTGRATKILCGLSADDAARLTDEALENLPADSAVPAYEIWRGRIQNHFGQTRQPQKA